MLDFHRDLYGKMVRLEFVSRLRGQEKFGNVDDLVAQITKDVEATREALA